MPLSKRYFGTNLKMYKTNRQTTEYLSQLAKFSEHIDRVNTELFVIPSFTAIKDASSIVDHRQILIGAQNMHWAEAGQYTGEISPLMLSELNVDIVELGHSERRHCFGESDEFIAKKVASALKHRFIALLCVGETSEEKCGGQADAVLKRQLEIGLGSASAESIGHIRIAYEPTWSIGVNGEPADPRYVAERHGNIRRTLRSLFGSVGDDIPILYGGGVNLENASKYIQIPETNGLFVGRCAWDAERFVKLIDIATNIV